LLSVGNAPIEIALDNHNLTLIMGKNGSGKTTIVEALVFGLYGKPLRPFNKPALVNSINQKQCVVEVEFVSGKKNYRVVRGIKPNVFEIYENGKLINQDPSIRDYQKVLEQQILKINYRAFTQVVIIGSGAYVPFMRLKAHERREFIEDLLDIRVFSVMNSLLKDKTKALKELIKDVDVEIKSLREKIELQDRHIKSRKTEKQSTIDTFVSEINTLVSENDTTQTFIISLMTTVDSLQQESEQYESASDRLTELRTVHKRIETNIKKYHSEKEFLHEIEECPTCRQSVHDSHRECIVGSVDLKIKDLEDDLISLQIQLKAVNVDITKFEEYSVKINEVNLEIGRLNKLIMVNNAMIESRKTQMECVISDNVNIDEETKILKDYARKVVKKSELKKELIDQQQYQYSAAALLQDNGIKAKIVKQYIPVINRLINKYLDAMDLFVGFHLDENFNEFIKSRHRDAFTYESFSDGQKRRIDAALLLTWRDIAKSKNSVNTNLAFFDEFDSVLDAAGADVLMDLYRASGIQNVFIISHKEGLSNSADSVIEIEMKNSFTQIKED
jgi:DNA repair exonuclease SbcCD ATPase subunit